MTKRKYQVHIVRRYGYNVLMVWDETQNFEVGMYGGDYRDIGEFHQVMKYAYDNGFEIEYRTGTSLASTDPTPEKMKSDFVKTVLAGEIKDTDIITINETKNDRALTLTGEEFKESFRLEIDQQIVSVYCYDDEHNKYTGMHATEIDTVTVKRKDD